MKRICFVATAEFVFTSFLLNHLRALSQKYDVTVVVNTNNPNFLLENGIFVNLVHLNIKRDISLIKDLTVLVKLIVIFYRGRFNAIHSVTPKAGLLAILAAWMLRTPLRVHTFTGQVWVSKTGFKRKLLRQFDILIARLTTVNLVDSPSQLQFLLNEKVLTAEKSVVFGEGSISGVDLAKFKPNPLARILLRQELAIADNAFIFLFLGRLTKDKGVLDLAQAFSEIFASNIHLLYVGPDEQEMQVKITRIVGKENSFVHFIGHTDIPEFYMAAADVLCLPSYREGFGTVVIEAAAAGVPTVASRIYGLTDAVVEGQTGLLHEPHDINAIKVCMEQMMVNQALRLKFAEQARTRAIKEFDSKLITQFWVNFYLKHVNYNE